MIGNKTQREREYELPPSIVNQGQFTFRVSNPERRQKILKLMEKVGTDRLGAAVWVAIDHYLESNGNAEKA